MFQLFMQLIMELVIRRLSMVLMTRAYSLTARANIWNASARQRVARQIAEDRAKQRAEVEGSGQEQQQAPENAVKFVLNDVKIDKSEVLAETEIKEITGKYICTAKKVI